MRKKYENFAQFYKTTNIVYMSILFGFLAFMTVVYFNTKNPTFSFSEDSSRVILGGILALIGFFGSSMTYKAILFRMDKSLPFSEKLSVYFKAFIVKMALLEAVGFVNILLYMTGYNKVYLIFGAISILGMLLAKPTPDMLIKDLDLNKNDQLYIDHPNKNFE